MNSRRWHRRTAASAIAAAFAGAGLACGESATGTPGGEERPPPVIASLTVSPGRATLPDGSTWAAVFTAVPRTTAGAEVEEFTPVWSLPDRPAWVLGTSATAGASLQVIVSYPMHDGIAAAEVHADSVRIVATVGSFTASATLRVIPKPGRLLLRGPAVAVAEVPTAMQLEVLEEHLQYRVDLDGYPVRWHSSDSAAVHIDAAGVITPAPGGSAWIRAELGGLRDSIRVTSDPGYEVEALAGFDSSRAVDIGAAGAVLAIGWRNGQSFGVQWSGDNVVELTGVRPVAVNAAGAVLGTSVATGRPVLWSRGIVTPLAGIDDLPYAAARDINDAGQVLLTQPAAIWQDGTVKPLADAASSYMARINSHGDAAGAVVQAGMPAAAVWKAGQPEHEYVPALGVRGTYAVGINDAGDVIGYGLPFHSVPGTGWFTPAGGTPVALPAAPVALNGHRVVLLEGAGRWKNSVAASLSDLVAGTGWSIVAAAAIDGAGHVAATGVHLETGRRSAVRLVPR